MKKLFCIVNAIVIFSAVTFGQNLYKPLLLGKSSPYYEGQDQLYHAIESTTEMFRKDPNALFAVRVCSFDPLPIAFANAAGLNWVTKQFDEQLDYLRNQTYPVNIPLSRIYYLRNDKGCGVYKNVGLTEYWFVPSEADFPDYIEINKPENLLEKTLIYSSKIDERVLSDENSENFITLTPDLYEILKIKLARMMKKDKTSLITIEYPSTGANKKIISNNAVKLKLLLAGKGIRAHRIFIKEGNYDDFDNENKNASFPNIEFFYYK